jgi:large subunit ribosomal protein L5
MLKNHYDSVVLGDMLLRYPNTKHVNQLPRIEKVVLHWSMLQIGMTSNHLPAAWSALHIISGQVPVLVETKKSASRWRRREGDIVSAIVTLRGDAMYAMLDTCLNVVFPQTRPFTGFDVSLIDSKGSCTVPIVQPILFPGIMDYYEAYVPLFSRPGRSLTVHTNCTSSDIGRAFLTSMQFPILNK